MRGKVVGIVLIVLIVVGIIVGFSLLYTEHKVEAMDGILVQIGDKV